MLLGAIIIIPVIGPRPARRKFEMHARPDVWIQESIKKQKFSKLGAEKAGKRIWTSDRMLSILGPPVLVVELFLLDEKHSTPDRIFLSMPRQNWRNAI
jgi:hypothetical protein